MRTIIFPFFICIFFGASAQMTGDLSVTISPEKMANDTFNLYRVVIANDKDSVVVIPHSLFCDLNETMPIAKNLAAQRFQEGWLEYSFMLSIEDTTIIPEYYPYSASFILPHQMLEFDIKIVKTPLRKFLNLKYYTLYNFNYRESIKGMTGKWLMRHRLQSKLVGF